jgi:hypothetical protein
MIVKCRENFAFLPLLYLITPTYYWYSLMGRDFGRSRSRLEGNFRMDLKETG